MNVVISGPFGNGTLADEAVLAGLLKHLASGKHTVTVLSADPERSKKIHGIEAIRQDSPSSFLSNKPAWAAMSRAHLFVLASGGRISAAGKQPARIWLAQLEHAQTGGLQTAVIGIGAELVTAARERARIQRLLHHCADAMSTRDDQSKQAMLGYGMNANRISSNGDPTLALLLPDAELKTPNPKVAGIVLATQLPTRLEFDAEDQSASAEMEDYTRSLLEGLLKSCDEVRLFHDDVEVASDLATKLAGKSAERVKTFCVSSPIADLQREMSACGALFSFSHHGLILAAISGVPVAGPASEPGATEFLASLGLKAFAVDLKDPATAVGAMNTLLAKASETAAAMRPKLIALKKKEAQNARMLELLVPRRVVRERDTSQPDFRPRAHKKRKE
jgi:polysaccharide pyruvyl transferase WcaK-like protein